MVQNGTPLPAHLAGPPLSDREAIADACYRAFLSIDQSSEELLKSCVTPDIYTDIAFKVCNGYDELRNKVWMNVSENVDTICVQGGYQPGNGESRTPPIIQATTFKYKSSEQMSRLFDLSESGYFYTRLQNPTNDTIAAKICEMEGGAAAMLTSSGQAANFFALFNNYI